jgi:hypothetical protein
VANVKEKADTMNLSNKVVVVVWVEVKEKADTMNLSNKRVAVVAVVAVNAKEVLTLLVAVVAVEASAEPRQIHDYEQYLSPLKTFLGADI